MPPRDIRSPHDPQQSVTQSEAYRGITSLARDAPSDRDPSIKLPSIASFTGEGRQHDVENRGDSLVLPRLEHYNLEQKESFDRGHSHASSSSSQYLGAGLSIHAETRSGTFMSSLLRAAKPMEEEKRFRASPMSLHSMLESNSTSSLPSTSEYANTNAAKRRRLDSGEERIADPMPSSSSAASSSRELLPEPLHDEVHRKIAQANPAAILAEIESRTFKPKPLSMSTAPRRRSFIPPSLLLEEEREDRTASTEYDRKVSIQNHTRASTYTRPWSSFDSHLSSPRTGQRQSDSVKKEDYPSTIIQQGHPNSGRPGLVAVKSEGEQVFVPQYQSNVHFRGQTNLHPLHHQQRDWSSLMPAEKKVSIQQSILAAQGDSSSSKVTTIRCMYANVAQKSYGSEKRFLCPPPCVKISGSSRNCQWASAQVVPIFISSTIQASPSTSNPSMSATIGGSEEEALMDAATKEVRFGKLHVGAMSDSRDKNFRLQISLYQGAFPHSPRGMGRMGALTSAVATTTSSASSSPWFTFHTSAINVISKPARKSIRTRAACPAIASGSIVCLYNRLNSQTVRTKYLTLDNTSSGNQYRLVARQEGWQGFSIELLAKPVANRQSRSSSNKSSSSNRNNGITYGSIVCLRDAATDTYSDPMMVCKVEKGKVDISGVVESDPKRARFQIVNDEAWRRLQALGIQGVTSDDPSESEDQDRRAQSVRVGEGDSASKESVPDSSVEGTSKRVGGSVGGAVVQMQKVTLMSVSPRIGKSIIGQSRSQEYIECDLETSTRYLCSTGHEDASAQDSRPALFHNIQRSESRATIQSRRGESTYRRDQDDQPASRSLEIAGSSTSSPVAFIRPPVPARREEEEEEEEEESILVNHVEDSFCWTVVTVSESRVSYIETNPQLNPTPVQAPPIINPPNISKITSFDQARSILLATIEGLFYKGNSDQSPTSPSRSWHGVEERHEVWVGQHGPLQYDVLTTDQFKSEISLQLPSVDQLLLIFREMQEARRVQRSLPDSFQLPLLLIRPNDGTSFISDYVIQLTRSSPPTLPTSHLALPSYGLAGQARSWTVTIVPRGTSLPLHP